MKFLLNYSRPSKRGVPFRLFVHSQQSGQESKHVIFTMTQIAYYGFNQHLGYNVASLDKNTFQ